jgi:hypothetical protein
MKHVKKNGDCLKILNIPKKNGIFLKYLPMTFCYLQSQKTLLYDDTNFLNKIYRKLRSEGKNTSFLGKRYFYFTLHEDKIKFIEVGFKINQKLENYDFSYSSKDYLNIVIENVKSPIGDLASYDKTFIDKGNSLFSSEDEYKNFIINKQPFYLEDYLNKLSPYNNMDKIRFEFGDIVNEILSEERDEKINKILE